MDNNAENNSIGPLIGIIIIIIVLIAGALYFLNAKNVSVLEQTPAFEINTTDQLNDANSALELKAVMTQSTSSEIDSIEKDLQNTTFDGLNIE